MDHPDLVALLRGELSLQAATQAADHLNECASCQHDLADVVLGHSLLLASARRVGAVPVVPPPFDRLQERLDTPVTGTPVTHAPVSGTPVTRASSPLPTGSGAGPARPLPQRLLAGSIAASAVLLVAGIAFVLGRAPLENEATDTESVEAAATWDLRPVASSAPDGAAESAGGLVSLASTSEDGTDTARITITPRGLPTPAAEQFYYAWLLEPRTQKMLPLGQLNAAGTTTFEVSQDLASDYRAVDISLEADDGDPAHSPVSVLRARFAEPPDVPPDIEPEAAASIARP